MLNIVNQTTRKIDIKKWRKWVKLFSPKPPLNVFIIYSPFPKDYKKDQPHRGGYLFGEIFVFVDKIETAGSLDWIFLHELSHHIILENEELYNYLDVIEEDFKCYIKDSNLELDEYYKTNLNYEEFICDMFAIAVSGKTYDVDWYLSRGTK